MGETSPSNSHAASDGTDGAAGDVRAPQRVAQLIQNREDPVVDLRFRGRRDLPRCDLCTAPADDRVTVMGDEIMKHVDLEPQDRRLRSKRVAFKSGH
jgi:hypothetical protein